MKYHHYKSNTVIMFQYYHKHAEKKGLEYNLKVQDMHRSRWDTGDWTDDSDQMILMIDSILDKNGEVCTCIIYMSHYMS